MTPSVQSLRVRTKRRQEVKSTPASGGVRCGSVDFPFPLAVPSLSQLVEMSEINEESCRETEVLALCCPQRETQNSQH